MDWSQDAPQLANQAVSDVALSILLQAGSSLSYKAISITDLYTMQHAGLKQIKQDLWEKGHPQVLSFSKTEDDRHRRTSLCDIAAPTARRRSERPQRPQFQELRGKVLIVLPGLNLAM